MSIQSTMIEFVKLTVCCCIVVTIHIEVLLGHAPLFVHEHGLVGGLCV